MDYRILGSTELNVSRLCFGALTIGPLQASLTPSEGAAVLCRAFSRGVNFLDTAQLYRTFPHIKLALSEYGRKDIVVATKSYAYDAKTAEETFKEALRELGTDYIDIFLLHEQESVHTLRGHFEALEYFTRMKKEGYIRAVGISTHKIEGVKAATLFSEYVDVIHPICNKRGVGIQDGKIEDMISAIEAFRAAGGGVYGMKPFGGGHLLSMRNECLDFALSLECLDSIAIGMQSFDEVDANVSYFETGGIPKELDDRIITKSRKVIIDDWCTGCGECVRKCSHNALSTKDGKALVDHSRCVTCGYCGAVCPDFCIKII